MLEIKKSKTADTRTCDFSKVSRTQLLESSLQHRDDVRQGFEYFMQLMRHQAFQHDMDKLTGLDQFHEDFKNGFQTTEWWDQHRKNARHHLLDPDGVPDDVNLIDVLDMVIDCVMAGMGRSGSVYPLDIDPRVLMKAFQNTVDLLKDQVKVVD